jgi:6-phosphogluconate dehydrogenase
MDLGVMGPARYHCAKLNAGSGSQRRCDSAEGGRSIFRGVWVGGLPAPPLFCLFRPRRASSSVRLGNARHSSPSLAHDPQGTGKWTIQQAAEMSVAAPTMAAALDARFLSGLKDERVFAQGMYDSLNVSPADAAAAQGVDKKQLIEDVKAALYASKICSYAQGYNIIRAKSAEQDWGVDLGSLARIWKGGCIIRAGFLDRIKQAYERNPKLNNLLVDPDFAKDLADRQEAWRRVVSLAVTSGIGAPGMTTSLSYFDTYRRGRGNANLVQAQRDFFGSHTYERVDKDGWFHTVWDETFGSADSITTSGYNQ